MIDATRIEVDSPIALLAIELWGDVPDLRRGLPALPAFDEGRDLDGGWRAIGVEPARWWLVGDRARAPEQRASLIEAVGGDGAVIDMTGAFQRLAITGRRWRSLLMIGGVFDAEDAAFTVGCGASTLLHHVTVRYDVTALDCVIIYVAPSYAEHLLHHLRDAAATLDVMEP